MKTTASVRKLLVAAIAAGNSIAVQAAPRLGAEFGAGLEYHSNAARVSEDEESDVAAIARAALTWRDNEGALVANLDYHAEHRDYQDDVEDDETAIDGSANVLWHALPRRLDLILQHQISETQTDLRAADTPSNRERRSIVTGGFDGFLTFSAVDSLVISPRFTDIKYSESEQSDSQRSNAALNWVHELDAVSKFRVGGEAGKVRFDNGNQDYDSQSAQLAYETALARLSYSLSGGVTHFDRDSYDDVDGHTIRASVNYREDDYEVGSNFVSELTDSSIGLSGNEFSLTNFQANDANFAQVDVLQRSQLDFYWQQRLDAVSTINVSVGASKDDYETQPLDQDRAFAEAGYRYTINAFWNVGARARYERADFSDDPLGRKHHTTTVDLGAQYRVTQDFDVRLSLTQVDRRADESADEYSDSVAMVTVNYRLF